MKCEYPECKTILSEYNHNDFCFAHSVAGNDLRLRQEERKKEMQRASNREKCKLNGRLKREQAKIKIQEVSWKTDVSRVGRT